MAGDSVTEELLYRVSLRVLSSDITNDVRDDVVRNLHEQLSPRWKATTDKALKAEGDSLVLDLRPIVERVFERVGLPIPARLQQAGAEGKGVVVSGRRQSGPWCCVVFRQQPRRIFVLALLAAIACLAGAACSSKDPMRGISHAGFAVATAGVLTLLLIVIGNSFIPEERVALRELVQSLEANLRKESVLLLAVGAIIALGTDAGIRANVAAARRDIGAHVQRVGTGTSLLLALGVGGRTALVT